MDPGEIDAMTKQWLALAALVFSNNQFSLHAHMERMRSKGVTDRAFAEAVGVLAYFGGLGTATNAFGMHQDFNPEMPATR